MTKNTTVSCVIPVYDGPRFIGEAIESALSQTFAPFEIIVVEDGSTDDSAAEAARFGDAVTYLVQGNGGSASARNLGVRRATGQLIAFLDADDVWHADKTKQQIAAFEEDAQVGASFTFMRNFWMSEVEHEVGELKDSRLTEVQVGGASTFMARRLLFDTLGPLDETLKHRDIQEFTIRARSQGWAVETLENTLVRRRVHDNNASRKRSTAGDLELLEIARASISRDRRRATT